MIEVTYIFDLSRYLSISIVTSKPLVISISVPQITHEIIKCYLIFYKEYTFIVLDIWAGCGLLISNDCRFSSRVVLCQHIYAVVRKGERVCSGWGHHC